MPAQINISDTMLGDNFFKGIDNGFVYCAGENSRYYDSCLPAGVLTAAGLPAAVLTKSGLPEVVLTQAGPPAGVSTEAGLSRMLSPDPFLQSPANSQNYNRYSYAMPVRICKASSGNNPLKYTDPSGYFVGGPEKGERKAERPISIINPVYNGHGQIISFGFGGNNFNNNGFSASVVTHGEDTDGDGVEDEFSLVATKPTDNWAINKGINVLTVQEFLVAEYETTQVTVGDQTFFYKKLRKAYIEKEIVEQNDGGGVDPSITGGLSVGGGFVSELKDSYQYGSNTVKYAQRINGKVRSSAVIARVSQMNAARMATGLKIAGRVATGLSIATAGYQFYSSDMSGNDYARLAGSVIITGSAFIPVVGPVISIGLGVADSYGTFNGIYNYFE